MSDVAGPASGARGGGTDPWSGGSPPPVLLAALGAAALIAVTLIALVASSGDGGNDGQIVPAGGVLGTATTAQTRVTLTVSIDGSGSGTVGIAPGVSCSRSCEHEFASGTRLTVTADAADGSTFDGWGDACSGTARCSLVVEDGRSLTASFDESATASCDADPDCDTGDGETPSDRPVAPSDCHDGRDNDGDGLTDAAQDPSCDHGSEAGSSAPPATPPAPSTNPPPAPATANECDDGRDNDGDGLTDRAQDPNCATGTSEGAKQARSEGTKQPRSECQDGRDNDGDGLIDSAQDPGCAKDNTEAG